MTYKVNVNDLQLTFGETDTVRSISQNVAIILRTRQGTCPMYREFGLPQEYLDKPVPVARSLMFAEIKEAVEEFEPRCSVVNITFAPDASAPGGLIPTVEVEINDE